MSCLCRTSPSSCGKNVLLQCLLRVFEVHLSYPTSYSAWVCVWVRCERRSNGRFSCLSHGDNTVVCKIRPSTAGLGLRHDHEFLHVHTCLSPGASFVPRRPLSFPGTILYCPSFSPASSLAGLLTPQISEGTRRILTLSLESLYVSLTFRLHFILTRVH